MILPATVLHFANSAGAQRDKTCYGHVAGGDRTVQGRWLCLTQKALLVPSLDGDISHLGAISHLGLRLSGQPGVGFDRWERAAAR